MQTKYVFIDFENVQPSALHVLEKQQVKVFVFVGASQTKVAIDVAESLQRLGESATYVRISGNGSNALDFHIAFYIGQLAAEYPQAHFHIISKDTGFDPLIAHLKKRKINVSRSKDVPGVPAVPAAPAAKAAPSKATPSKATTSKTSTSTAHKDKISVVLEHLNKCKKNLPGTQKTLGNTINSLFQKALPETEVADLLKQMTKQGLITVSGTKLAYKLG